MKNGLQSVGASIHIQKILSQLSQEFGFTRFSQFSAGERRVPLFRATTTDDKHMIVKIGIGGDEQRTEVENNILGYKAIAEIGAAGILPSELETRTILDVPVIVMTDLGNDFEHQVRAGGLDAYEIFFQKMAEIYASTLKKSHGQLAGLQTVRDLLLQWYQELVSKEAVDPKILEKIASLDMEKLSGSSSTLMLMDFTPNNIFVGDGKVSFIDPWLQDTYLGSPIPSIGQFITLSHDVHNYPGSEENRSRFIDFTLKLGDDLGLSDEQVEAQFNLGAALQFSLSGYVRIGGEEDQRGRNYVYEGAQLISQLS